MAIPPRLDTLKWVLLGGFGTMFVWGWLIYGGGRWRLWARRTGQLWL